MNAVGADQRVAFSDGAVFQAQRDPSAILVESGATAVEMDGLRFLAPHRIGKYALQIGAMERPIGKAVALDGFSAKIEQLLGFPRVPDVNLFALGLPADRLDLGPEAELIENPGAVGADLESGADLHDLGRLLIDVDIEAALEQRQRRGQPADARAGDQNLRFSAHIFLIRDFPIETAPSS